MAAVNARHGLRHLRNAAKAARTITNDARPTTHSTIDSNSSAPASQHQRSNARNPFERAVKATTPADTPAASQYDPNTRTPTLKQRPSPLLTFIYQPHPKPINCTTFTPTAVIATDPAHPFHIRTQRRLSAFDPLKLTWRVQVSVAVSKKPAIRREAERRVKNIFRAELENEGAGIKGALLMVVNKDPLRALRFRREEAREEIVGWIGRVGREQNNRSRRGVPSGHASRNV